MVIGILGGGQLGKMLCQSATELGFKTIIYAPQNGEPAPAEQACNEIIYAGFEDKPSLKKFAENADIISFEFENIPVESIRFLESIKPVYPNSNAIYITQNRLREKNFLKENNFPTNKFWEASSASDIKNSFSQGLNKAVLKTASFGYDGKGQKTTHSTDDFSEVWNELSFHHVIIEEFIPFEQEISVVLARDAKGNIENFSIGRNIHENGILQESIIPAEISDETKNQAIKVAKNIAEKLKEPNQRIEDYQHF